MLDSRRFWFLSGLFLTTLSTLTLEILDTRLLSVLTWYHLSFFAVSIAMFGMSAGAVQVYLGGDRFQREGATKALATYSSLYAIAVPASHIGNLCVPLPAEITTTSFAALLLTTILLSVPFYLSGVIVSICLTRVPGPIGLFYAWDLIGASLGSLLILPLLAWGNITSAAFVCGLIAALGAICFRVYAPRSGYSHVVLLALALAGGAALQNTAYGLRVIYPKGELQPVSQITHEFWSIHGQVIARKPETHQPFMWGPGVGVDAYQVEQRMMFIDGAAGTSMSRWDGQRESLAWTGLDVTSLPYHLRPNGDVAIIGTGGGRDVLTALWAKSRSITGIEINHAFIHMLTGPLREFAGLVDQPEVRLVHDEARSYLTRTPDRYDVLQMSLIDTWAATGAGAFTLSENGLYTVEAWEVFLSTLKPRGIYSVSRWYAADRPSEIGRLVALASASLLRRGVEDPPRHLALVGRENVATLLLSSDPFSSEDVKTLETVSENLGFDILVAPGHAPHDELLSGFLLGRSVEDINRLAAAQSLDYTPPTDERPYFFNLVRPSMLFSGLSEIGTPGVIGGNMLATLTLCLLIAVTVLLVAVTILFPLLRSGLPSMGRWDFGASILYFSLIGAGFMLIQISFMQRFSVYLGHPTYAVSVILFSMILAAGLGSFISDRIPANRGLAWFYVLPSGLSLLLLLVTLGLQSVIDGTIMHGLLARCLIVVGLVAPVSFLLGFFFPIGLRLVSQLSADALPWMWGVNGACGVLAGVSAVAISMWNGIRSSLFVAIIAYALLIVPGSYLRHRVRRL